MRKKLLFIFLLGSIISCKDTNIEPKQSVAYAKVVFEYQDGTIEETRLITLK